MKIAIPITANHIAEHFGHCEQYSIFEIKENQIIKEESIAPPSDKSEKTPLFLKDHNVNVVIVRGIGIKALQFFSEHKIKVISGVSPQPPEKLVNDYLKDQLSGGLNLCDH